MHARIPTAEDEDPGAWTRVGTLSELKAAAIAESNRQRSEEHARVDQFRDEELRNLEETFAMMEREQLRDQETH